MKGAVVLLQWTRWHSGGDIQHDNILESHQCTMASWYTHVTDVTAWYTHATDVTGEVWRIHVGGRKGWSAHTHTHKHAHTRTHDQHQPSPGYTPSPLHGKLTQTRG